MDIVRIRNSISYLRTPWNVTMKLKGFVEFTGKTKNEATPQVPLVTLQSNGTLVLNPAAYSAMKDPDSVVFLYDSTEKKIALRNSTPGVAHAFSVKKMANNNYAVNMRSFCKYHAISPTRAIRFEPTYIGNVMVLALDAGLETTRGRPKKG